MVVYDDKILEELIVEKKKYKRTLNQQDDKGVWKKIGSSKRFSIIFKRKNIKMVEKYSKIKRGTL